MNDELRQMTQSGDVETRRRAALALADLPTDEALAHLDRLLGDVNWRVRKAAVESAITFAPEAIIPVLLEGLYDAENAGRRNTSVEALIKIGPSVLPFLYERLVEEDVDVKLALILLMGEIPSRSSIPHLIYFLSHDNKNIVSAAVSSLGRLKDPSTLPILVDLLNRSDDWTNFHLIDAFAEIGGPEAVDRLLSMYPNDRYRKAILKALGKMADLSVLPFLLENALDSEPHIQELMSAIGRIYHANMPEAFLKRHQAEMAEIVRRHFPLQLTEKVSALWKDSKVAERRGMLHIAGFLTDMTLIDYVLDELENPYLQRDALQAAAAFGTPAVPHLVRRLNAAVSVEQRLFLIQLLAATGSPEGVVPLLSQVRGDDDQVKMEGLAGLGRIEDDRSLQELTAVLKEPDPAFHEVAIHAVHTLLKQRPEFRDRVRKQGEAMLTSPEDRTRRNGYALLAESIAYGADGNLLKGLKDPSPDVRRFVVGLAGARIGPDAKDQLLPMLSDDNPKVRRAVITTLGRYLLGSGPDILLTTLQDEDLWVRSEAAFYLAQSTDPATADALLTLLEEDELPVRISALKGLAEVGCGALFGRVLELARNDPNMEIRRVCLGALARSGRSEGQALLMKALEDRHWEIRSAAIELMGDSADRRFLPVLLKELERDPDVLVKQSVIQALSRLGAVEAVPRLLQYLTDKDLKEAAYQFFLGLGRRYVPLIEHEAQSVDFQTKLILIEIMKSLELA